MKLKLAWSVLADSFSKWNEHKALVESASQPGAGVIAAVGGVAGIVLEPAEDLNTIMVQ